MSERGLTTQSRVAVPRQSSLRGALEWIMVVAGALLIAFVVKTFLIQAFYIPSLSMSPALAVNDRVLVNKVTYRLGNVERGDVVVFRGDESEGSKDLIKRVVGLPGDTLEVRDGNVMINGRVLDEPYLEPDQTSQPLSQTSRWVVGADEYFVMGDNRSNSRDSRFFNPIEESAIVGKAFIKVWPLTDFSLL
ncbi:MAG: signal peptidase I [Acidimicrobiales bacterium]